MRVRFKELFLWHVPDRKGRVTVAYEAGREYTVKRACGEEAIAAGKAEEVKGSVNHNE
jgi:hypothetical protein